MLKPLYFLGVKILRSVDISPETFRNVQRGGSGICSSNFGLALVSGSVHTAVCEPRRHGGHGVSFSVSSVPPWLFSSLNHRRFVVAPSRVCGRCRYQPPGRTLLTGLVFSVSREECTRNSDFATQCPEEQYQTPSCLSYRGMVVTPIGNPTRQSAVYSSTSFA